MYTQKKSVNKLKILIVFSYGNLFYPKAGNESRINHLTRGLACNNEIITLERVEFQKHNINTEIAKERYFFNDLNFKNTHFGIFFSDLNPFYFLKINRLIKNENPDIIQISYPRGLIAAKLCNFFNQRKNNILVYESHDVQVEVSKINSRDHSIPYIKRKIIYLYDIIIEKIAVEVADHITAVSVLDKNKFIRRYSLNPQKISVIPSAIEIPKLDDIGTKSQCRESLGIENHKIVVVFHGVYNYLPNKEAVNFIENFIEPEISKFHDNVVFVIAGKGLLKHKKGNIMYLGFVDDLHKFLKAADIAIVPVLKGGGTRIKVLDYMCLSLPIVSTKKGIEGIDATNYENAIIVDSVNNEFIDAIKYLIENEHVRKKIGSNARKLAEAKYDFKKLGGKLSDLYRQLLNDKIQVNK